MEQEEERFKRLSTAPTTEVVTVLDDYGRLSRMLSDAAAGLAGLPLLFLIDWEALAQGPVTRLRGERLRYLQDHKRELLVEHAKRVGHLMAFVSSSDETQTRWVYATLVNAPVVSSLHHDFGPLLKPFGADATGNLGVIDQVLGKWKELSEAGGPRRHARHGFREVRKGRTPSGACLELPVGEGPRAFRHAQQGVGRSNVINRVFRVAKRSDSFATPLEA